MVILSNLPPPSEGVKFQQPQTSALIETQELGVGTLYVAESCVSWVGPEGKGFSLQYPAISLHAVSRDRSSFPEECLYVMVEAPASERRRRKKKYAQPSLLFESMTSQLAGWKLANSEAQTKTSDTSEIVGSACGSGQNVTNGEGNQATDEAEEEEGDQDPITQIRFIPVDKSVLDDLFKAMSECQALHPDENESFSEEEDDEGAEVLDDEGEGFGEEEWFTSPEDVVHLNEDGQAVLNRVMAAAGDGASNEQEIEEDESMDTGQFEDAVENQ